MTNYGLQAYLYFLFHLWQGLIYNYQTKTNISLTGMNSFSKKKSLNLTSGSHGESQNRWAALLYYVLTIQQKLPCLEASKRFTPPPPPLPAPTNSGCGECRCASACSPPECWKVILEGISEQGSSHFVHTSFLSLPVVSLPPPIPKCWMFVCSFSFQRNYRRPLYLFIIAAIKKESPKSLEFVNKGNNSFDILLFQRTSC